MINKKELFLTSLCSAAVLSCAPVRNANPVVPAKLYADNLKREIASRNGEGSFQSPANLSKEVLPLGRFVSLPQEDPRARVRLVNEATSENGNPPTVKFIGQAGAQDQVSNTENGQPPSGGYYAYRAAEPTARDYQGPLNLGEPGLTSSLWKESRGGNDLFRDSRAWQAMDLITIVVQEQSEGKKSADTEVKQKSTLAAAIDSLLGLEKQAKAANSDLDPTSLFKASTQNDFKGEGTTNRKDTLTARMSAMVAEVLPSGVLRIEGQKIIAVNNEEQVMVISGLVRPTDVNSANEVASNKIANMRIDYFGNGSLGEAQQGGWGSRLLRTLWPF